jgi:Beta propeller domain
MYVKFLVAGVILSFLGASCTVLAVDQDDSNSARQEDEEEIVSLRRRGLTWKPVWWDRIKNSYKGNDLKLCPMRSAPAKASWCERKKYTCFFGNKTCPTVGANPTVKCVCNGTRTKKGKWSCTPAKCPTPVPAPGIFRSSPGRPFDVRMNLLTPQILQGYDKIADLVFDLDQAVRFYVNAIIEQESQYNYQYYPYYPGVEGIPLAEDHAAGAHIPSPTPPSAEGTTDFQTNNQEEGVDESDMVKSDGIHVFAAYGDIVVIWNAATGDFVTNYTLPPIQNVDSPTVDVPSGVDGTAGTGENPSAGAMLPPMFYQPKPIIQGMSLVVNRLVLFVQGYGDKVRAENNITSALGEAYETRVVVLDTSTLPKTITVVTQKDIQGGFRDARSIGNNIHLVTSSSINFYQVTGPLYRFNTGFQGMNSTEYKSAAVNIAKPLIADFVAMLTNDILINGKAPDIPKIAIWQSDVGDKGNVIEQIYSGGAI